LNLERVSFYLESSTTLNKLISFIDRLVMLVLECIK